MTNPSAHPPLAALERDPPTLELAAHLEGCAACRVERRLLLAGPSEAAANPTPPEEPEAPPVAPPAEDLPPAPRYRLGPLLGAGSSAEVFRAFDPQLHREVALKILTRHGPRARARFLAEARVTAQLDHPNIVPILHLGVTEDGRPYVAEREVRGVSLAEAVRSGRLATLEARVDALRKVCSAVAFAHRRGVLHRDLKPDNVMVGDLGEVQVVDWGLSGHLEGSPEAGAEEEGEGPAWPTRDGEVVGTPAWMAPEQARGEHADARADVYALGAILHFLAVGRPPVLAGDPAELLAALAEGGVPGPRDVDPRVPREIDAIVRRATAPDPRDRYAEVRALLEDLDAWMERRPLPHVGSRPAERLSKLVLRYWRALWALGGMLRLVVLAAGLGSLDDGL